MQLSRRPKAFYQILLAFMKYTSTVEHLEKEKDHPSLIISEIIDSQKSSYLNV